MKGAALMVVSAAPGCACTVGPTYRKPAEHADATGRFVSVDSQAIAQDEPPDQWWHLFHDAVLDELISEALTANTDLRAAAANLAGAEAVLQQSRAARSPQTAIRGGPEYAQLSAEQYLLENRIPTLWIYDVGIDVQWRLDVSGQVRRSIEAASADSEAARAARDVARVRVAAEVASAYAEACAASYSLGITQHSVDLQRESAQIAARLYRGGRGITLDVTRASAQVDQLRANVPALRLSRSWRYTDSPRCWGGRRRKCPRRQPNVLGYPPPRRPFQLEMVRVCCDAGPMSVRQSATSLRRLPGLVSLSVTFTRRCIWAHRPDPRERLPIAFNPTRGGGPSAP